LRFLQVKLFTSEDHGQGQMHIDIVDRCLLVLCSLPIVACDTSV